MMKAINTGAVINTILRSDTELMELINNNVFPIIAEECSFPFIVYRRSSTQHENYKHGIIRETANVEIVIVADNYKSSVSIAQRVSDILHNYKDEEKTIIITEADESYNNSNDSYLQTLNFKIDYE